MGLWAPKPAMEPGRLAKWNGCCSCEICDCHKGWSQRDYREKEAARRGGAFGLPW